MESEAKSRSGANRRECEEIGLSFRPAASLTRTRGSEWGLGPLCSVVIQASYVLGFSELMGCYSLELHTTLNTFPDDTKNTYLIFRFVPPAGSDNPARWQLSIDSEVNVLDDLAAHGVGHSEVQF